MSKGTDLAAAAMEQHADNAQACQAANTARLKAESDFVVSAKLVADAQEAIRQEADQLLADAALPTPK